MIYKSSRAKLAAIFSAALLTVGIAGGIAAPAASAADSISCASGTSRIAVATSDASYSNNGLCLVNGAFKAVYQSDGNFVVYKNNSAIWSSQTGGRGGTRIALQADSNLVIYSVNRAIWASGSGAGKLWNGTQLRMQADGNLVIYGEGNGSLTALWSTGTAGA